MITHWETETGCRIRREEHLGLSFKVKERSITGQLQTLMLTLKQECIDSSNTTLLFKIWQFHKESAWNSGDPGSGRSLGEGNGNPLLNYRSFSIKTVATKKYKQNINNTIHTNTNTHTHTHNDTFCWLLSFIQLLSTRKLAKISICTYLSIYIILKLQT